MIEERMARIWSELLGVPRVGLHERFRDLGGDSVKLVRLYAEVLEVFGVDLPADELFADPTVAGMSKAIESARARQAETEAGNVPISG